MTDTTLLSGAAPDVVVVVGGIAGLAAALAVAPQARVMVVSKGPTDDGCTAPAQGGIAAAVGAGRLAADPLR